MTVYGYLRVSTSEQALTGHGLDAQRDTIQQVAHRRGWTEVAWHVDGGHSGKDLDRPAMRDLLAKIRKDDVLVVAKLDRLSRSLVDFAGLMQQASRRGWSFVALDLGVDTTTATGRLVANVMASVSEWEREVIGQRTKEGMAIARAKGRVPRSAFLPGGLHPRANPHRAKGRVEPPGDRLWSLVRRDPHRNGPTGLDG